MTQRQRRLALAMELVIEMGACEGDDPLHGDDLLEEGLGMRVLVSGTAVSVGLG